MPTQMRRRLTVGTSILFAAMALVGCGHKQGDTAGNTPAKVQQDVQQQAAQRAAYYNSHPQPGQNMASNPAYRGHP